MLISFLDINCGGILADDGTQLQLKQLFELVSIQALMLGSFKVKYCMCLRINFLFLRLKRSF